MIKQISQDIIKKNIKVKNIKVLDSLSASVGLGLLAIHAVDLKQNGTSYNKIINDILLRTKKHNKPLWRFIVDSEPSTIMKWLTFKNIEDAIKAIYKKATYKNILSLRKIKRSHVLSLVLSER